MGILFFERILKSLGRGEAIPFQAKSMQQASLRAYIVILIPTNKRSWIEPKTFLLIPFCCNFYYSAVAGSSPVDYNDMILVEVIQLLPFQTRVFPNILLSIRSLLIYFNASMLFVGGPSFRYMILWF